MNNVIEPIPRAPRHWSDAGPLSGLTWEVEQR